MTVTVIVENGTNIANANSYLSVANFKIYADAHGLSYAGKTDDQIGSALIRATAWIDATYRARWPGVRTYSTQTLQWPRKEGIYVYGTFYPNTYLTTVTDAEGVIIAINAIPSVLVSATAEAAYREVVTPGSLAPDMARGGAIKSVSAGSVAVEWFGAAPAETTFSVIDGLLSSILTSVNNGYTARAVRA